MSRSVVGGTDVDARRPERTLQWGSVVQGGPEFVRARLQVLREGERAADWARRSAPVIPSWPMNRLLLLLGPLRSFRVASRASTATNPCAR